MLGDFMVAGRRVLTQTLIIAASAMLVALLIASSPSKAMSMGDDLPPVESPSSDPVLNPDAEDSSTDDQPSDDSSSPDEGEQLDQTENDSGLHDGSDDTDPTQDPEEESP
ncbi:MAG: hypothetical protein KAI64_07490, partial [Thermoplasmata archaeon]|nr:hypothetical protein [Thermoplasmata archaeon]